MNKSAEAILTEHFALCEETYRLLLEENRILKQTSQPPNREFLDEKKGLLLCFDVSNRALAEADRAQVRQFRPAIEKSQQLVMKTLLLDRENEQLLLKCALGSKPKTTPPGFPGSGVEKVYRRALVS